MRAVLIGFLVAGCGQDPPARGPSDLTQEDDTHVTPDTDATAAPPSAIDVSVTLDGAPAAGVVVMQGGGTESWTTDANGQATVEVDPSIPGKMAVLASHPDARIKFVEPGDSEAVRLELESFDRSDNEAYVFQHPGTPEDQGDTSRCAHCHIAINADWYGSAHRSAAASDVVQDLYAGAAAAFNSVSACVAAGGAWWEGIEPGSGDVASRCYVGTGALPTMNDGCGDTEPCDTLATEYGACADCHAPGIDGRLGGRSLLDATGLAYEFGVHCDVCHKVEGVVLDAEAGVAGRLKVLRPTEPVAGPLGPWLPLTFGPFHDVGNIRMGSVVRDHYHEAEFCAGCHQLDQPVLVPGAALDATRWPDGRLPIHSTYAEWLAGPMNPAAPCQSCHMPPDPVSGNSADLYTHIFLEESVVTGWPRPPGSVRRHQWLGPRTPEGPMLALAATVDVVKSVDAGTVTASVTVKNAGPGHAIPTGEPLRSLVMRVRATCDQTALVATGGAAVPDFGGYLDLQDASGDWSRWPGASEGDLIRVVDRTGAWHDYVGFGPFGDGTFDAAAKGMAVEHVVGQAAVIAVNGDAVTLDSALPPGDIAYRVSGDAWPADGVAAVGQAGAPGFGFARVLADEAGERMVPHYAAVDVVSDNRLLPQQTWTSTHTFATPCADPVVTAVLVHRAWPMALALQKGWSLTDSVMVEVTR